MLLSLLQLWHLDHAVHKSVKARLLHSFPKNFPPCNTTQSCSYFRITRHIADNSTVLYKITEPTTAVQHFLRVSFGIKKRLIPGVFSRYTCSFATIDFEEVPHRILYYHPSSIFSIFTYFSKLHAVTKIMKTSLSTQVEQTPFSILKNTNTFIAWRRQFSVSRTLSTFTRER